MFFRPGDSSTGVPVVARRAGAVVTDAVHADDLPDRSRSVRLAGVRLLAWTADQTIRYVLDESDAGRGGIVVTPNLDHLRRAGSDPAFAAVVAEADVVVPDGMPLIWASRFQGSPLPERVAGSDLICTLTEAAAKRGKRVYFLGGAVGTAARAADILRRTTPELIVAGVYCPPLGFDEDDAEMGRMMAALVDARPDIVYVGLGSPKQEFLIDRIRAMLPQAWWLGVGVSFSFLCGDVKRAPKWLQRLGLEWTHRLIQEPRRLFKRYVMVGMPFGMRLLTQCAMKRVSGWVPFYREEATPTWSLHRPSVMPGSGLVFGMSGSGLESELTPATSGTNDRRAVGRAFGHDAAADAIGHATTSRPLSESEQRANDLIRVCGGDSMTDGPAHGRSSDALATSTDITSTEDPAGRGANASAGSFVGGTADASASRLLLRRLRGIVLLGGKVRPGPLEACARRSPLDLPLDAQHTLLTQWLAQAEALAERFDLPTLPVRVTVSGHTPVPTSGRVVGRAAGYQIEPDAGEYRGTGGVLHDLVARQDDPGSRDGHVSRGSVTPGGDPDPYGDDDYLLVANAAQVLLDPLAALAAALASKAVSAPSDRQPAAVSLIAHRDGTPSGLMLVAAKALRLLPKVGFVDMKEQGLPIIARRYDVRVVTCRRPTGIPIRTVADYLGALRTYHESGGSVGNTRVRRPDVADADPFAERWRRTFGLVEAGAQVDASADIHDSVVLSGAVIGAHATVVRSLVCGGQRVTQGGRVMETCLGEHPGR